MVKGIYMQSNLFSTDTKGAELSFRIMELPIL